jgi:hypothetical protein
VKLFVMGNVRIPNPISIIAVFAGIYAFRAKLVLQEFVNVCLIARVRSAVLTVVVEAAVRVQGVKHARPQEYANVYRIV